MNRVSGLTGSLCLVAVGCTNDTGTPLDILTEEGAAEDATAATLADTTEDSVAADVSVGDTETFRAEVCGDNWSAMYIGETLVMEDSVSITTERSFNEEIFEFEESRPFQLNVVMKDLIENGSGLEYIGQNNQQMGVAGTSRRSHLWPVAMSSRSPTRSGFV